MKSLRKILKASCLMMLVCSLSACTTSLISLPDVPRQNCQELPKPKPIVVVDQKQCPSISMPDPIPKDIKLLIVGGEVVDIDAGGEKLIRSYAATRKTIKSLWHD